VEEAAVCRLQGKSRFLVADAPRNDRPL